MNRITTFLLPLALLFPITASAKVISSISCVSPTFTYLESPPNKEFHHSIRLRSHGSGEYFVSGAAKTIERVNIDATTTSETETSIHFHSDNGIDDDWKCDITLISSGALNSIHCIDANNDVTLEITRQNENITNLPAWSYSVSMKLSEDTLKRLPSANVDLSTNRFIFKTETAVRLNQGCRIDYVN